MDRGAWWATVHRVAKSPTRLKELSTVYIYVYIYIYIYICIYICILAIYTYIAGSFCCAIETNTTL